MEKKAISLSLNIKSECKFERLIPNSESLEQTASFLRTVYKESAFFTTEYLKWLYSENPHGLVIGFNAYSKNKTLVGHYGLIPAQVLLFGKVKKIGLSINSASSFEMRGKGLFTTLAELSYAAAKAEGYEAIIGIANHHSTNAFVNQLKFDLVCPLEARICFSAPVPNEKQFASVKDLEFLYDSKSVNWRLNHPYHEYYISNTSPSFLVYRAFKVVEILMTFNSTVRDQLALRQTNVTYPKIWIGKSNNLSWRGVLNFKIPQRLRPSPLNLIFRDLIQNRRLRADSLHFECFDFDAY